jgi:uncharacterized OsmC-like protein
MSTFNYCGDSKMDTYISVDIEASGPIPGDYSILSIGACSVIDVRKNFYVELKPLVKVKLKNKNMNLKRLAFRMNYRKLIIMLASGVNWLCKHLI